MQTVQRHELHFLNKRPLGRAEERRQDRRDHPVAAEAIDAMENETAMERSVGAGR